MDRFKFVIVCCLSGQVEVLEVGNADVISIVAAVAHADELVDVGLRDREFKIVCQHGLEVTCVNDISVLLIEHLEALAGLLLFTALGPSVANEELGLVKAYTTAPGNFRVVLTELFLLLLGLLCVVAEVVKDVLEVGHRNILQLFLVVKLEGVGQVRLHIARNREAVDLARLVELTEVGIGFFLSGR